MKLRFALICLCFVSCYRIAENPDFQPLVSIQIQDRNGLTETISTPERLESYQTVDFLASQPYKKIVRVFKRDGKMGAKITTYHPNGQIWQYLESQDMRAFGAYREWHSNGVLKVDATIIGGTADVVAGAQKDWLFDGPAKIWNEQGNLLAEFEYNKGLLEGKSRSFYSSGQLQAESTYHQNRLEGEIFDYYLDGKTRSISTYKYGMKHGPSFGFWGNGSHCWEESYQENTLLDGRYYAKDGALASDVVSGFGFQAIFKDSILEQLVEFRRGQPEGTVEFFFPNGELKLSYHIKNGRKQGEEIQYFSSQEKADELSKERLPKLSIPWESDLISGMVKTWYNDGKLQAQKEFSRNKKNGSSVAWYKSGALMLMEEYEEDLIIKGQYFKKTQKEPVSTISNGTGTATLFDEQGIFLRKVQYIKGKPVDPES